ncbi:hypothetical protein M378DRAFT_175273 [Amanita muscaria Koide BX008]|uniref:Spc7 kinetochore protein domain-containing protein n=1 Tax=Amanita muscaria (strain Koide BX008) TaxID=946122 RepID=A0A0C2TUJ2_AMAMK|nr:hypothetical protein M378DRAFT_175273 [Amanita muscaria Koide BX008]
MSARRDSPNRRKSIAVSSQNKPAFIERTKRRAHSIVPGDRLSPLTRARRSLGPRKSILKGSATNFSSHGSQQSTQSSNPDDLNATQSMDLTTDMQYNPDNTSRRSLSRRVSFAGHARVRLFHLPNHDNTNSTGSPPSSPTSPSATSSNDHGVAPHSQQFNDENDYPGARLNRRRSSLRHSIAPSEDMDLTSVGFGNVPQEDSAIADEQFEGMDDMDLSDAIDEVLIRRRSSLAVGPSSHVQDDEELSRTEEVYPSEDTDQSREQDQDSMEFTVPINRPIRPAHKDDAWLALRRMTHSGGSEDPSEVDEAAETSGQSIDMEDNIQEDSLDEDNSRDMDDENQTINISKMLGWPGQIEHDISRLSIGGESNMEESEVYGPAAQPIQTVPQPPTIPASRPSQPNRDSERQKPPPAEPNVTSKPSVFHPPPSQSSNAEAEGRPFPLQTPSPFTFRAPAAVSNGNPASPSKIPIFKPTFTAAFAPPATRPTPKKSTADKTPTNPPSTSKRPRPIEDDGSVDEADMSGGLPSPAKRQAMANKWPSSTPSHAPTASPSSASLPKPKPLSPSKKAPFQASSASTSTSRSATSSLRRPSGYLARRKSLAVGASSQSETPSGQDGTIGNQTLSGAKAGLGFRRASVGSGSASAWQGFDKNNVPAQGTTIEIQSTSQTVKDIFKAVSSTPPRRIPSPAKTSAPPTIRLSAQSPPTSQSTGEPLSPTRGAASPGRRIPAAQPTSSLDLSHILHSTADNEADEEASGEPGAERHVDVENDTMQWRNKVDQEVPANEEIPSISIDQFIAITGIRFMDELTVPQRSSHPPRHRHTRQARDESEIKLSEYFASMAIDVPQLELYTRVANDLEAWMEQSRSVFAQAEEEAAKITPELFVEYSRADEEGQAELLHQLNIIRTNVRAQARSDWYDWKYQWVQGLKVTADKAFDALEEDAKTLEQISTLADEIIPELEREYERVMRELEQEKAEVAEIEASDQDYLNELKSAIAEQNIEVEALKAEVAEGDSRLQRLQERFEEIEAQKRGNSTAIADAKRVLHEPKSSTRAEVFNLKEELEYLEDLHMFKLIQMEADIFQYIYNSQFQVTIPCSNFAPLVTQVDITRIQASQTRYRDLFPKLSDFFLEVAKRQIIEGDDQTCKQIVHRLGDYWASCTLLRTQLKLLGIKFPVDIEIVQPATEEELPSFKAHTTVLFTAAKAKAIISFVFSTATFCYWPITLDSLDCEVQVEYGPIEWVLQCIIMLESTDGNNQPRKDT